MTVVGTLTRHDVEHARLCGRTRCLSPRDGSRATSLELKANRLAAQRLQRLRVLLAGHDFKFAGELVEMLESRSDIELRVDHWQTLHKHDELASQKLNSWADVVLCEWAGPNVGLVRRPQEAWPTAP